MIKNILCIFAIALLICLPSLVYAGDLKEINLGEEAQGEWFQKNDKVKFIYHGRANVISIEKITNKSIKITIFPNLEEGIELTLKKGDKLRLDLNKDQRTDVEINLYLIKNGSAFLIFKSLDDRKKVENIITGKFYAEGVVEEKNNIMYYLLFAIFSLFIFLIILNYKAKRR